MDELFGIPTERLTLVLLAVFTAGGLLLAFLARRDRVAFKMAVRNTSRRKTQTALIVIGSYWQRCSSQRRSPPATP
jgi:hypothetical protein